MKFANYAKYVLIAGLFAALVISPKTAAIVAATAEPPSQEELNEISRQAEVQKETDKWVEEATAPTHQTVAGTKSQVDGFYMAQKVDGVAMAPTGGAEKDSYVKVMDTDKTKSAAAVAVANNAAAEVGGIVGPCIDVDYGKMVNGKFTESTDGTAGTFSIGVPNDFATAGAQYAVAAIYQGGAYEIFENTSTNPKTVTVNVGQAKSPKVMYALIKITG